MNSTGQDDQYISRLIQCAIDESEEIYRTGITNTLPIQEFCVQSSSTPFIQRSFGANDPFCLNTTLHVPINRNEECIVTNGSAQHFIKEQDYSQFNLKKPVAPISGVNNSTLKLKNFAYNETGLRSNVAAYLEDNTEEVIKRKKFENNYFNLFMARECERKAASEQIDERAIVEKVRGTKKLKDKPGSNAKKFFCPNTTGVVNKEISKTKVKSSKTNICHTNETGDEENVIVGSDSECSDVKENSIYGTESKGSQERNPNILLTEADELKDITEVIRIIKELNEEDLNQDKNCVNVLEPDLVLLCKFCGLFYPSDSELDSHMNSEHPKNEINNSFHEHEKEYIRLSEELVEEQKARRAQEQNQFIIEEDDSDDVESDMDWIQDSGENQAFEANHDCINPVSSTKQSGRRPKKCQNKRCDVSNRSRRGRKRARVRKHSDAGIDEGRTKKRRMVDRELVHNSEEQIEDADASDDDDDVILVEEPIDLVVLDSDDSHNEDNEDNEDVVERQNVRTDVKEASVRSDGFKPSVVSPKKKNISQESSQPNNVTDEFLLQKYGIKNVTVSVEKSPFKLSQTQIYVMPSLSKDKQCKTKIQMKVVGQGILNQADELEIQDENVDEHSLQSIPDCVLPKSDDSLSVGSIRSLSFTKADDQISEISNRSVSPQPSTSSGYIYVPRKRTARKSVKDEALKKQYSLKEVRVMLKNISSVERALLRNPHSSFGKSDWLHKLQHNTDSDSDDNLDWKAPIMSLLDSDEDEMAVSKRNENSPVKGKGKALSKSKKSQNNINTSKKCCLETSAKFKGVGDVSDWTSVEVCNSMKPPTRTRKDFAQGPTKRALRKSDQDEALIKQYGLKKPKILLQSVGKKEASVMKKPNPKDKTTKWLQSFHEQASSNHVDKNDLKEPVAMTESNGKTMALRSQESKSEKYTGKLQAKTRALGQSSDNKTNNNLLHDVSTLCRKACNSDANLLQKFGITRSQVVLRNQKANESTKQDSKFKSKVELSTKEDSPKQCNLQNSSRESIKVNVSEKRKEITRKVKMRGGLSKNVENNDIPRQKQSPRKKSRCSLLEMNVRKKRIRGCSVEPLTWDKKKIGSKHETEVCKPFTIPLIPVDDKKVASIDDEAEIADSQKTSVSLECVTKGQSEDLDKVSNDTTDLHTDPSKCMKEDEDDYNKTDAVSEGNINERIMTCKSKENEMENGEISTDAVALFPTLCNSELPTGTIKEHSDKPDTVEKDDKGGQKKRYKRSKDSEQDDSDVEEQEQYSSKKNLAKHSTKELPVLKKMILQLKKIDEAKDDAKGISKALASENTLSCKSKDVNPEINKKSCSGKEVDDSNLKQVDDTENIKADVLLEIAENESKPDDSHDDHKSIETDIDKNKCSDSSARNLTYSYNGFESNPGNDLCSSSISDADLKDGENSSENKQIKQCESESSNKEKVNETKVEIKDSNSGDSDIDESEKIDGEITKTEDNEGKSKTSISNIDHSFSLAESVDEKTEEEGDIESHDEDTNSKIKPCGSDEVDGMVCNEPLQKMNESINVSDEEKDERSAEAVHVDTIASEGNIEDPEIPLDAEGDSGISQDQVLQSDTKKSDIAQDPVKNIKTNPANATESPEVHASSDNDSMSVVHESDLTNSSSSELDCDAKSMTHGLELTNCVPVRSGCSVSVVDSISESIVGDVTIHDKP